MAFLYTEAGNVLQEIYEKRVGVRTALYKKSINDRMIRKVSALVHNVLANDSLLSAVLGVPNPKGGRSLSRVDASITEIKKGSVFSLASALSDFLFVGKVQGGGALKKEIDAQKDTYLERFKKFKEVYPPSTTQDRERPPVSERYVRVNSFSRKVSSLESLRARLEKDLGSWVKIDPALPDVLECDPAKDSALVGHELVKNGTLVLQDRGSCLSAITLDVQPGDHVLDVCAAPGSKSLHCLERLKGNGSLTCVERDLKRAQVLIRRLKATGQLEGPYPGNQLLAIAGAKEDKRKNKDDANEPLCAKWRKAVRDGKVSACANVLSSNLRDARAAIEDTCGSHIVLLGSEASPATANIEVHVFVADYMALCGASQGAAYASTKEAVSIPMPLRRATKCTLDPSCSGSGLPIHLKANHGDGGHSTTARLSSLSTFQVKMLTATLTCLPNLKAATYSTCSVESIENELVVDKVVNDVLSDSTIWQPKAAVPKNWEVCDLPKDVLEEAAKRTSTAPASGDLLKRICECSARALPAVHRCRGFYICHLVREDIKKGLPKCRDETMFEDVANANAVEEEEIIEGEQEEGGKRKRQEEEAGEVAEGGKKKAKGANGQASTPATPAANGKKEQQAAKKLPARPMKVKLPSNKRR